jgi:hypothetical protein
MLGMLILIGADLVQRLEFKIQVNTCTHLPGEAGTGSNDNEF